MHYGACSWCDNIQVMHLLKIVTSIMIKNASAFSLLLSNESKILKRIVKKINIVRPKKMKNDILHAEMYFMKLHN
jgi:flagellar motor component MotA